MDRQRKSKRSHYTFRNLKKINFTMIHIKPSILILAFFVTQITKAQTDTKTYDFKDFDKVQIENVNGAIEIELGKFYSITVLGNNNAQEQVQISKSKDKLLVTLDSKFVTDWQRFSD